MMTEPTESTLHSSLHPSFRPSSHPPSHLLSSTSLSTPASSHPLEAPLTNMPSARVDSILKRLVAANRQREECLERKEAAQNRMDTGLLALEANEKQHHVYEQQLYAYQRAFFIAKESLDKVDQTILSLSEDLRDSRFKKHLPPKHPPSLTHVSEHTRTSSYSSLLSLSSDNQSIVSVPMW